LVRNFVICVDAGIRFPGIKAEIRVVYQTYLLPDNIARTRPVVARFASNARGLPSLRRYHGLCFRDLAQKVLPRCKVLIHES
jgi:hypothetical protein